MQKAKIIVAVRKRPLFEKEKSKGYTDIITVNGTNQVVVSEMKQKVDLTKYIEDSVFNFDYAFHEQSTNEEIYDYIISPLIESAFEGAKVSCFAYGQTGSGKTHTMNGVISKGMPGLYTLGAMDIFSRLQEPEFSHLSAYLSFYEIYCTKLYDLLNKRTELVLRQDAKSNINVVGLSQIPVSSVEEFQNHLKIGSSQRVTSQNSANSQSSRSHAILQITLKNGKKTFGKVYFIDLAGNERGADHMNMKKQTQKDGQQINKSLLQLKECIRGLDQGKNHVPFRGSKLTMCLKDSFIGFCRTVMIGNLSPSSSSSENTLNTLRYADRVKELKNSEELTKQELKSREMMLPRQNKNAIKIAISNSDDEDDIAQKKRKAYGAKVEEPAVTSPSINLKQRNSSTAKQSEVFNRKHSIGGSNSNALKSNISQNQQPVKGSSSMSKQNEIGGNRRMGGDQTTNSRRMNKNEGSEYANKNGLSLNLSEHSQMMQSSIQQRSRDEGLQRSAGNSMDMRRNNNYLKSGSNAGNLTSRSNNAGNNLSNPLQREGGLSNRNNQGHINGRQGMANMDYRMDSNGAYNHPNTNGRATNATNANNASNSLYLNSRPSSSSQHQNPYQVNLPVSQFQSSQSPYRQQEPISPMPKNPLHKANNFFSNPQTSNQQQGPSTNVYYNHNPANGNPIRQSNNQFKNQPTRSGHSNDFSSHPESWNELVEAISNSSLSAETRQEYNMLLNENLLESENQLISQHSTTLQSEIQKIKEEMETIKVIEEDRSQITSKEYAQMMYESIDEKMSQLEMLKETLTTFMYKLDDMEEVERQIELLNSTYRTKNHHQDEQLLDDFD